LAREGETFGVEEGRHRLQRFARRYIDIRAPGRLLERAARIGIGPDDGASIGGQQEFIEGLEIGPGWRLARILALIRALCPGRLRPQTNRRDEAGGKYSLPEPSRHNLVSGHKFTVQV